MLVGQYAALAQEQEQVRSGKTLPRNYLIRVKQFSEFVDRFNFQKDFLNNDIGPEFESIITRNDYILLLFNHDDKRLDPEVEDDTYQIFVSMFIREVCSDSILIDRISENIFAELNCQININGKDQELNMLLKQEFDNGLKWGIVAVSDDFIRSYPYQQTKIYAANNEESPEIYIPPYSNETNFMDLKTLFNNHENLNSLSSGDCVGENLNGFYNLIRNGSLKYRHVKSIKYHILDIPGWILVVTNFQRDTDNSGWLISDLLLMDDIRTYFKEKYAYYLPVTMQEY
jgi:hypothetical protein